MALPAEALDALYAAPLDEFVQRRNEVVRERRAAGDVAGAAEAKALPKPSVAVWALNQLARLETERLEAVVAALDRQRDLQLGALDGSLDAKALSAARAAEKAAVSDLLAAAEALLVDHGHAASRATLDRVARVLRAQAIDPSMREPLLAGWLSSEEPVGGFDAAAQQIDPALLLAALSSQPKPKKKRAASGDNFFARAARGSKRREEAPASEPVPSAIASHRRRKEAREAELARAEATRRAKEAEEAREVALRAAEARVAEREAEATAAAQAIERLEGEVRAAEQTLDELRRELGSARRRREDVDERLRQARRELAEARVAVG